MTENEILSGLLSLTFCMADDFYFRKCMFYNVPRLSDFDKRKCVDEAVELLPKFLEYYKKASEAAEGKDKCLSRCDWSEA